MPDDVSRSVCPLCGSEAPWVGRRYEHLSPVGERVLYRATVDHVRGDVAVFTDVEHLHGPTPPTGAAVHLLGGEDWRVMPDD